MKVVSVVLVRPAMTLAACTARTLAALVQYDKA